MKSNLKVRQPLQKIILPVKSKDDRKEIELMEDVILEEINVKQIEYVADESAIIKKKSKPNFKSLGPKFGKSVQPIAARLRELIIRRNQQTSVARNACNECQQDRLYNRHK